MNKYHKWVIDSEAASRFYQGIIAIEDLRLIPFRIRRWWALRKVRTWKPVHNRIVHEDHKV